MINQSQVTGLKELDDKMAALKFALQSSEVKNRMGKFLRDIIYRRIKSGKGVSSEESQSPSHAKLKALSPAYIKLRQSLSGTHVTVKTKNGKRKRQKVEAGRESWFRSITPGEFFDPRRSNLTMSGQLLDSMKEENTLDGIRVYFPNTMRTNSKLTNAQLYEFVKKDRPHFALTDGEFRILQNEYEKIVQEKIKVIFNK